MKIREQIFCITAEDEISRSIEKGELVNGEQINILVAGHTHLRRCRKNGSFSCYYNTGTWTPLVHLKPEIINDKDYFSSVVKKLHQRDVLDDFRTPQQSGGKTFPAMVRDEPTIFCVKPHDGQRVRAVLFNAAEDGSLSEIHGTRTEGGI
jgi:hypothetical protein